MAKKWKPPVREPRPARLYVAVSFDDLDVFFKVRRELESTFGKVDYETESQETASLLSLYGGVARSQIRFLSYARPIGREELVDIRRKLLNLEMRHVHEGRPLAELDPGCVSEFNVVRTSLEEDFHRIYLYGGIFAETLYYYERMTFRPYLHTPEFYRRPEIITIFNDLCLIHSTQK